MTKWDDAYCFIEDSVCEALDTEDINEILTQEKQDAVSDILTWLREQVPTS